VRRQTKKRRLLYGKFLCARPIYGMAGNEDMMIVDQRISISLLVCCWDYLDLLKCKI